ncbi:MAG TPA: amidohydrolase family protein [Terriglobales bacterium]|nr:amidohydrolase family protein [Terriglobales bacterium]
MAGGATADPPLLDLHQHTHYNGRSDTELLAHQAFHRVTTTVLLPGDGWMLSVLGDNASCAALQAEYPERFVRFACANVAESRTPDVLRGNLRRGALGIGELKFHVSVDSPEMLRVYALAAEVGVPVLIHFEYVTYDTGLERFEAVLRAHPKVNFIGHAQTWWGNISAELNPLEMYPKGPVKPGGSHRPAARGLRQCLWRSLGRGGPDPSRRQHSVWRPPVLHLVNCLATGNLKQQSSLGFAEGYRLP